MELLESLLYREVRGNEATERGRIFEAFAREHYANVSHAAEKCGLVIHPNPSRIMALR